MHVSMCGIYYNCLNSCLVITENGCNVCTVFTVFHVPRKELGPVISVLCLRYRQILGSHLHSHCMFNCFFPIWYRQASASLVPHIHTLSLLIFMFTSALFFYILNVILITVTNTRRSLKPIIFSITIYQR